MIIVADRFHRYHRIGSRSAKLARRAHSREFDQLQQGYSDAAAAAPPISGVSEGRSELFSIDADDDISDIADEDRSQRHVVFNNQDLQLNARNGIEERPESEKELPSSGQPVVVDPVVPSHTRAASPSNVYDRLSARGRDYAQRRLNWAPPKNMVSESSFYCTDK